MSNQAAHKLAALGSMCAKREEQISSSASDSVIVVVPNDLLAVE